MKRKLRFLAGACLFTATALFSGCSSDDDFLMDPVDSGTSQTRAVTNPDGTLTITFDDFDPGMLAGPTSAGENLYSYQGYPQVTTIYDNTPEEYLFLSMFNTVGGAQSIPAAASHFPTGTSAPISREIPETGGILI